MKTMNDIFNDYGVNTTTNFQLMKWAKELNIPNLKVLMKDEVKDYVKDHSNVIVNLDDSYEKGVHWSCFHSDDNYVYFFDSFALPPTDEVKNKFPDKEFKNNYFTVQDLGEKHCGQLCLFVLYKLSKNEDFENILLELFDQNFPEKMRPEIIEQKLRNIINENKPKTITINGKQYYISRPKIEEIKQKEKEGGFLPALLPFLFPALAALGATAGGAAGIAKAVDDSRHNREMEKIARGGKLKEYEFNEKGNKTLDSTRDSVKSIILNINEYVDSLKDLNDTERKQLKESLLFLSKIVNIKKTGDGLFLNPYRGGGILDSAIDGFVNMAEDLSNEAKKKVKNMLKDLSTHIKVDSTGEGLFLNPYKKA